MWNAFRLTTCSGMSRKVGTGNYLVAVFTVFRHPVCRSTFARFPVVLKSAFGLEAAVAVCAFELIWVAVTFVQSFYVDAQATRI